MMNTVDCFDPKRFRIFQEIEQNLQNVRERIANAAHRAGRQSEDVSLVAVTKYAKPNDGVVEGFIRTGQCDLAENRPQLLLDKVDFWRRKKLSSPNGIHEILGTESKDSNNVLRWHFIGSLQRNKVRRILPVVSLIHSVDSWKLLQTIERILNEEADLTSREGNTVEQCAEAMVFPQDVSVLLEVHISNDSAKQGFSTEELRQLIPNLATLRRIKFCGLMGMAGLNVSPEEVKRQFKSLRSIFEELRPMTPVPESFRELSMGMSGDFECAIEEGATIVRLGSILYPHEF